MNNRNQPSPIDAPNFVANTEDPNLKLENFLTPVQRVIANTLVTVPLTSVVSVLMERIFFSAIKQPIQVTVTGYAGSWIYRTASGACKAGIYTNKGEISRKLEQPHEHGELSERESFQGKPSGRNMLLTTAIIAPTACFSTFYLNVMSSLNLQNQKLYYSLQEYNFSKRVGIIFGVGYGNNSFGLPTRFTKELVGVLAFTATEVLKTPLAKVLPEGQALPAAVVISGTFSGVVDTALSKITAHTLRKTVRQENGKFNVPTFFATGLRIFNEQGVKKMFFHGSASHVVGNSVVYGVVQAVPYVVDNLLKIVQPSKRGFFTMKNAPIKIPTPASANAVSEKLENPPAKSRL